MRCLWVSRSEKETRIGYLGDESGPLEIETQLSLELRKLRRKTVSDWLLEREGLKRWRPSMY